MKVMLFSPTGKIGKRLAEFIETAGLMLGGLQEIQGEMFIRY